jgi:hypothetical protein
MEDSPRMARRSFHQSLRLEDQWKVRRAWRGESSIFADVLHQLVDSRPPRLPIGGFATARLPTGRFATAPPPFGRFARPLRQPVDTRRPRRSWETVP